MKLLWWLKILKLLYPLFSFRGLSETWGRRKYDLIPSSTSDEWIPSRFFCHLNLCQWICDRKWLWGYKLHWSELDWTRSQMQEWVLCNFMRRCPHKLLHPALMSHFLRGQSWLGLTYHWIYTIILSVCFYVTEKDCGPPKKQPNMNFNITDGTLFSAVIKVYCDRG